MSLSKIGRGNYIIVFVATIMFLVSMTLTIAAGVAPGLSLVWNVLAALYISYDVIPANLLANPLIFISSLLDAFVFALFAVFLATWFIGVIRSINIAEYLTMRRVARLRNHVIVAPYNDFSKVLAEELAREGIRFVVIADNESDGARLYGMKMLTVVGEMRSEDVLKNAGIEQAAYVIACADDDVKNALISIAAKDANPNIKVISRVIEEENLQKLNKAGASLVVIPGVTAGNKMGDEIVKRLV